jgi:hypothetical protein
VRVVSALTEPGGHYKPFHGFTVFRRIDDSHRLVTGSRHFHLRSATQGSAIIGQAIMLRVAKGLSVLTVTVALTTTLLITDSAWAQATAQLNGRVADESGAALPGVTVTATQTDTSITRTVVTDVSGAWTMPNMPKTISAPSRQGNSRISS